MLIYESFQSAISTSFSYSREGIYTTTASTAESQVDSGGGIFFINGVGQTISGTTLSIYADIYETRQTLLTTIEITGSATHQHIAGATTDLSSFSNIFRQTIASYFTINATLTSTETSSSSSSSGISGSFTDSASSSDGGTTSFTQDSTATYLQTTTTAFTSTATYRHTATTSTTMLSTSVLGTMTVIYYPTTSAYTTFTATQTVTQQSRWVSTVVVSTSTRGPVLNQWVAIADAAFYTFTTVIAGQTVTMTSGNEVLLIPTTTAPGLAAWSDIGTTADSADLLKYKLFTAQFSDYPLVTSTSSAAGPNNDVINGTYFFYSHTFSYHTILPTATSDTVSYHATRFLKTTSTSTLTLTTSSTADTTVFGTTTYDSGFTSYTQTSFSVTGTVTFTESTTTGLTTTVTTFSTYFTSSWNGSDEVDFTSSYTVAIGSTISSESTTQTATSEVGVTVTDTITSSNGSYSQTYSYSGTTLVSTGTETTTQTSTYLTGTTTSTSAKSNNYLPFETGSTTTSLTGFIEIYTTTAKSEKTTTTGSTQTLASDANLLGNKTTCDQTFTVHTTIETTIQIPWSYHKESTTTVVTTTVSSVLTLRTTRVGAVMIDGMTPDLLRGNDVVWTLPDRVFQQQEIQSWTETLVGATQSFTNNGSTFASTHEEFSHNGIVMRSDLSQMGIFAAAAGKPFQVHPCMAIGFRPATNDQISSPIYFSPTFSVGTFSIWAWEKFTTTTTTGSGPGTVTTTAVSTAATIQTLSTVPFSHISLHQGTSASLFVSSPFTESFSTIRSYASSWGSYKSFTTTSTRTTTTSTDASTINTTAASFVSRTGSFTVAETTISLFSGNTIFITRSCPVVFTTNEAGAKLYSWDERYTPNSFATTQTESILIVFGASITDSTHLRNEAGNDPGIPLVYGGWHPVTSQTGYAVLTLDGNTTYTTVPVLVIGAAYKMTVSPRSGGATTTTTVTLTFYSISENHTFGKYEVYLTNALSLIHAIEPLTYFSIIAPVTTITSNVLGIDGIPFVTTTTRYAFRDEDTTTH